MSARILLIDRDEAVLDALTRELAELGLDVTGTLHPERAADAFAPAEFDLVAIGGGVDAATRAEVRRAFPAGNPSLRVLDVHAPVAVRQIMAAVAGDDRGPGVDLAAYAVRIGHTGPLRPDLATLRALHARHPDAIPFENLDVLLGRGVDLAPAAVDAKLIGRRRGGYCFEQNGLFRRVLLAIGFEVTGLAARVRWNAPAGTPPPARTHMVLRIGLDGEDWLADVGFGTCALTAPLRMATDAPQSTGHDSYRLVRFGEDLLMQVRRDGAWLPVYEIGPEPQRDADYEAANWYTSTHPTSHFRHGIRVARTAADCRYTLLDGRFGIRRPDGRTERTTLDADGIERALGDVFGLPVEPEWRPAIERAAAGPG